MIFSYMRAEEKITHLEAYHRKELRSKRMGKNNPNGNIIVNDRGQYSRFDLGAHRHMFGKIKDEYVIGKWETSKSLTIREIKMLGPSFMDKLQEITGEEGERSVDIITRYGYELLDDQVQQLNLEIG